MGLEKFKCQWPEQRLLAEIPGFDQAALVEWYQILASREAMKLYPDSSTYYRDESGKRVVECPKCNRPMRQDTARYFFCNSCRNVWELMN